MHKNIEKKKNENFILFCSQIDSFNIFSNQLWCIIYQFGHRVNKAEIIKLVWHCKGIKETCLERFLCGLHWAFSGQSKGLLPHSHINVSSSNKFMLFTNNPLRCWLALPLFTVNASDLAIHVCFVHLMPWNRSPESP